MVCSGKTPLVSCKPFTTSSNHTWENKNKKLGIKSGRNHWPHLLREQVSGLTSDAPPIVTEVLENHKKLLSRERTNPNFPY